MSKDPRIDFAQWLELDEQNANIIETYQQHAERGGHTSPAQIRTLVELGYHAGAIRTAQRAHTSIRRLLVVSVVLLAPLVLLIVGNSIWSILHGNYDWQLRWSDLFALAFLLVLFRKEIRSGFARGWHGAQSRYVSWRHAPAESSART